MSTIIPQPITRSYIKEMDLSRALLGLETTENFWYRENEMRSIVKTINPTFNLEEIDRRDILVKGVPGWIDQGTVGTHPSAKNAKLILKLIKRELRKTTDVELIADLMCSLAAKGKTAVFNVIEQTVEIVN